MLLAFALQAADESTAWMERREVLTREAERLSEAYKNVTARVTQPAEDVNIPLETHASGAVALMIGAKRAQLFLDEDFIWAEGVKVIRRDERGEVVMSVEATRCLFDRSTKSGWAAGPTKIRQGNSEFDGEDVYFSHPENYVMSMTRSLIRTKDLKLGGAVKDRVPNGEGLSVLSRRCDFDREKGIAFFEGAVRVDYQPDYSMNADRLFVYFKGTNELDRIEAERNVAVTNQLRAGQCARAVFRRATGEIEMFGDGANSRARLIDVGSSEATGRTIKFWIDRECVEIEDSEILVNKGKGGLKSL